ncbi:M48 family metalloprotease [Pontivivens ytuae]|uniref:M48 family metalloprotease n=1 Tax=Pontivivens ytuae TaxID=2789856 RepID=A0A7S9QEA0_9RHOB|nr:M48 family metalloprotease [Pontivivens ytuae]QPH55745.1 M48 family metalloprotease [Pontivivens ytuae]
MVHRLFAALALLVLGACASGTAWEQDRFAGLSSEEEFLIAQYGGVIETGPLAAHVREIGTRIAAQTRDAEADQWRFRLLNSGELNAFAVPGGTVYVTRGIATLANDEAELAAVIGHEIAHLAAGHSESFSARRQQAARDIENGWVAAGRISDPDRAAATAQDTLENALGGLAAYSRQQELEADRIGFDLMVRSGYDPRGQERLLTAMSDFASTRALSFGTSQMMEQVDFLASHPGTGTRQEEARRLASAAGNGAQERGDHLAAIDGVVWGETGENGFVRGGRWIHPSLDLSFLLPSGFLPYLGPGAVLAESETGAFVLFDVVPRDRGRAPQPYVIDLLAEIDPKLLTALPERPQTTTIGEARAAVIDMTLDFEGTLVDQQLYSIVLDDLVARFVIGAPRQDPGALDRLRAAVRSLSPIPAAQQADLAPRRIEVHTVRAGENVPSLAQRMKVEGAAEQYFRLINRLGPGQVLAPGMQVKLIVE